MLKKENAKCPACNKSIEQNVQFCSHCGKKIITTEEWTDVIANNIIATTEEMDDYSKMLKILGFNENITDQMKVEKIIWRLFTVNMVTQELSTKEEMETVNNLLHNAIAKKMYKTEKEMHDFFETIQDRYKTYYSIINDREDDWTTTLSLLYLDYLIFGKIGDNEYPNGDKLYFVALSIAEDFATFLNFVRTEWFNAE